MAVDMNNGGVYYEGVRDDGKYMYFYVTYTDTNGDSIDPPQGRRVFSDNPPAQKNIDDTNNYVVPTDNPFVFRVTDPNGTQVDIASSELNQQYPVTMPNPPPLAAPPDPPSDITEAAGDTQNFAVPTTTQAEAELDDKLATQSDPGQESPAVPANYVNSSDDNRSEKFKAKLQSLSNAEDRLIFTVMPDISESHSANYEEAPIIQHPGQIMRYRSTDARRWSVTGKFIARTMQEADELMDYVNMIRTWLMPYYGQGTATSSAKSLLGAPPPVLVFQAYGPRAIGPVNCVLTNFNWSWPSDVDWIQTAGAEPEPAPTVLQVQLDLTETWSPREFSSFDILSYRMGRMDKAFDSSRIVSSDTKSANLTTAATVGVQPSSISPAEAAVATANKPQTFLDRMQDQIARDKNFNGVLK